MSEPSAESAVVIRYEELNQAFQESPSPEDLLGDEGTDLERAIFLVALGEALRTFEEEDQLADPDVLTVPRNRVASLMLSLLAEEPPEGSTLEDLDAGGKELKFAKNDIGGWLKSLFQHVSKDQFHELLRPGSTAPAPLPDRARVALLADWGTGLYGAPEIAKAIEAAAEPYDFLFHLGDVYYSGTPKEVQNRFLGLWPKRPEATSRALNSNHEMYSGGHAYFAETLPAFGQASSYFALQNDHWLLVGLDTGYVDHDLDDQQVEWLRAVVAAAADRKVVLFSHHQLFSWFDSQGDALAAKLGDLLVPGKIFAWYWGHEHRCCLYEPVPRFGGLRARCLGHGGMPSPAKKLEGLAEDHRVGQFVWRRHPPKNLLPHGLVLGGPNEFIKKKENKYLPHGYMTIELDGPDLVEKVHAATGEEILARPLV